MAKEQVEFSFALVQRIGGTTAFCDFILCGGEIASISLSTQSGFDDAGYGLSGLAKQLCHKLDEVRAALFQVILVILCRPGGALQQVGTDVAERIAQ